MDFEIFNKGAINIALVFHVQQCQRVSNANPLAGLPNESGPGLTSLSQCDAISQTKLPTFLCCIRLKPAWHSQPGMGVVMKPPKNLYIRSSRQQSLSLNQIKKADPSFHLLAKFKLQG